MNVAMLTSIIIIIVIVTNKNSIDAFLPPGSVLFCFFGHILQFFFTYLLTYWSEYKKYSYSKKEEGIEILKQNTTQRQHFHFTEDKCYCFVQ